MTPAQQRRASELCALLPTLQAEMFRIGLYRTGHALDAAVKAIGYEVADSRKSETVVIRGAGVRRLRVGKSP